MQYSGVNLSRYQINHPRVLMQCDFAVINFMLIFYKFLFLGLYNYYRQVHLLINFTNYQFFFVFNF